MESCRRWLEVILRKCGSILGSTGNACPSFWLNQHLSQRLPRLVTESVERMCLGPMKDLLEQVLHHCHLSAKRKASTTFQ